MKTFKAIVYYVLVSVYILIPIFVSNILSERNIELPYHIRELAMVWWYSVLVIYVYWRDKDKPKRKSGSNEISYRDKGQNDWLQRD